MTYRPKRLAEAIKKEVFDILKNDLRDPRIGFITITNVEVSTDLQHAKIFTSIYGSDQEQKKTMEILQKAQGYIRGEIGRRIRVRYTPEVMFKLDKSIAQGSKIISLMEKVKNEEGTQSE